MLWGRLIQWYCHSQVYEKQRYVSAVVRINNTLVGSHMAQNNKAGRGWGCPRVHPRLLHWSALHDADSRGEGEERKEEQQRKQIGWGSQLSVSLLSFAEQLPFAFSLSLACSGFQALLAWADNRKSSSRGVHSLQHHPDHAAVEKE